MLKLAQRHVRSALTALCAGALVGVAGSALADDPDGPAPLAPDNAPAAEAPATTDAPAHEVETGSTYSATSVQASDGEEPSFKAETTRQTWPNVPMLTTGATIFGVSYLPAVIAGATADVPDDKDLYIPVAGPFMMLTQGPEEERVYKALLVTDGVVQGVGALLMLSSFFVPEERTKHWYLIGANDDLRLTPSRVGTGYGLGAAGRF